MELNVSNVKISAPCANVELIVSRDGSEYNCDRMSVNECDGEFIICTRARRNYGTACRVYRVVDGEIREIETTIDDGFYEDRQVLFYSK